MNEIEHYINSVDERRKDVFKRLFYVIKNHLPEGFEAAMQYDMPTFIVPLHTYPKGYLNRKNEPLPFISIGVQKNHIALYHMGLYGMEDLKAWFEHKYAKEVATKLNMGKSCIRFTNINHIPYELIGELCEKVSVEEWIQKYETGHRKS
ncbi:DUF1801 domain-containing protein [Mammaliicoccus stepanovicii]|uniref:Domain of uncharacterized function (DU1801) n=1 Tax=Mammaliicoccus stepanovicii TaxID=643214 RepID=A0A239YRN0_9STAP|nr:DUF1801 domain-containing protein [Mammaliicoccus stepanovicii]PNZ75889.1 DUF1801 domain-containing protein [Mammaliicoccus stepanovicii]GGI42351.1 hypothetical protein GCM10010896_17990 [Mammaliicoccus stepanovicii]SNV61749.1 Domain of uncharacterised function (DU1801) [Mammaliicoccus stepanovicii]